MSASRLSRTFEDYADYAGLNSPEAATTLAFIPVMGTGFPAFQMACMDLSARTFLVATIKLNSLDQCNDIREIGRKTRSFIQI